MLLVVVVVMGSACTPPPAHGSPDVGDPSRDAGAALAPNGDTGVSSLSLLPHQRRWVLEMQVTLRWARELSETLKYWWQGSDTAAVHRGVIRAEDRVISFARQHGAPRLAVGWSPIHDVDHPLALRYDDMMRTALGNRLSAVGHLAQMVRTVLDDLGRGDARHPEIALLVSATTEELLASQVSPNTTSPS